MATSVPTTAIGYTQTPQYTQLSYEDELTPELQWPNSITVYNQMRRTDSQCASVLRAVTLPVRRTPWRIDPAGASLEVAQFVADDLGLPVVGQKPKPPLRAKDKFSWSEHLRLALLMLPLGHSYFEQVYRVEPDGSRAHLRKLELRPSTSIERIDVAEDGGLIAIKQYWTATNSAPKPIPVNRLVAYIHEREGGNWLGSSILRSAYKNFLLKERLLRVQAQTIERNGMGIPVYEAAETEADLTAGLGMATSLRAGEASGTAIPFGAKLRLMGVEGTLPDADPVVRYHDEAIARAVLAHFLNLGTQTGSWALGTTFADFFTLSLQTLAQQIADTATQHIIEDLVDINFGPQEPAPRLVFDEIGSRQAATAQSLKSLVDAGLITPDAVLDENLRQQFGLPPADPATATPPPAQPAPSPAPDPEPVPGEGSVAASADTAALLDRALRIIAQFETPSRRRPVRANRKRGYGSVGKALATLRTLRRRLSGALLAELDQIIAQLAGAAPVTAHGTHNQKDHGRRRTGTLGSVLDKLSSLREKLSDEDRSTLDRAMDQLRGLESSDVDDDDLIEDEPDDEPGDEPDDDSEDDVMDSDVGELKFTPYLGGEVDIDWEDGQRGFRLGPAAQREVADAVEKFRGLPAEDAPELPDFGPPPATVTTEEEFIKWRNGRLNAWYESEAYAEYNRIIAEVTTSDGEFKVIRQANGNTAIGSPETFDDASEDWDDVIQFSDGEQSEEFVRLLRQSTAQTGVRASARRPVTAHGNHDQSTHGRKKGLTDALKGAVSKPAPRKAAPRKPAPAPSASEVDQAKLKLDRAVQMHGSDRSKWSKQDRDAAAKLDKLIADGEASAPKAPARKRAAPKTADNSTAGAPMLTREQAQAMQADMLKGSPWTPQQRAGLKAYSGDHYQAMNGALRDPSRKPTERVKAWIRSASEGMRPTPRPLRVFRVVNSNGLGIKSGEKLETLIGRTFQNPGFSSTAVDIQGTYSAGAVRAVMMIDVPEGTKAAYIDNFSRFTGEAELLLDAGTKFEYYAVENDPAYSVPVVRARVVAA